MAYLRLRYTSVAGCSGFGSALSFTPHMVPYKVFPRFQFLPHTSETGIIPPFSA